MASRSNSLRADTNSSEKAFTLLEIMMVMAFIVIIGGFSLIVGLDSYRGYLFHSDRDNLVTALQRARAQSIGNVCLGASCTDGKPHGVAIHPADHPNSIVIFQTEVSTPTYAARTAEDQAQDVLLDTTSSTNFGGASEIVFTELSANVSVAGTITTSAGTHSSNISIGSEGQIFWTN